MNDTSDLIVKSVTIKKPIKASYQGHTRYLCVHGIGYKTRRDGDQVLQIIAYQYDGETSKGQVKYGSNHKENWRCMTVSYLEAVNILEDEEWYTSENHSTSSKCIDKYISQVDY